MHGQEANPAKDEGRSKRRPRYRGAFPRSFQERYKELHPDQFPEMQEHVRAQGRTPAGTHIPVLLDEVIDCLRPLQGEVVADLTLGYGGHALAFLEHIGPEGRLFGFDVDAVELDRARCRLEQAGFGKQVTLLRSNFAGVDKALRANQVPGFDILFADLGVSSMQIDDPQRGLSYKQDGPLDMRMDLRIPQTAADLLASMSRNDLSDLLRDHGDEPDHDRIAAEIVRRRIQSPILRTKELVRLVFEVKGLPRRKWSNGKSPAEREIHPAARTFQALRMRVNDESGCLRQLLRIAPYCLNPEGRIGIISFHSGEDRIVKRAFRAGLRDGIFTTVSDQPLRPGPTETRNNPRSRSAKFRWARTPESANSRGPV